MLSLRLQTIANYITPGNRLVDVGTDHAYLPVYAVKSGICPSALACDIGTGPLAAAARTIEKEGLVYRAGMQDGYVRTRLSDGLHKVKPGEGETLVIAGMGGLLIMKILSECPKAAASFDEIILGAQSDLPAVRARMAGHYTLAADTMVCEDGKYYPVMRYVPGGETLEKAQIMYGKSRCGTVVSYLEREQTIKQKILSQLTGQTGRIDEIKEELELIETILRECECYRENANENQD